MVKIIDYKISQSTDGKDFVSLKLQGGVEPIQSMQTGKFYLTAKTCYIPSTFDVASASALVGSSLPGQVVRVDSEPYEYTIKDTGEVISLSHRYEYQPEPVRSNSTVEHSSEPLLELADL